jgi:hypothetical protein
MIESPPKVSRSALKGRIEANEGALHLYRRKSLEKDADQALFSFHHVFLFAFLFARL